MPLSLDIKDFPSEMFFLVNDFDFGRVCTYLQPHFSFGEVELHMVPTLLQYLLQVIRPNVPQIAGNFVQLTRRKNKKFVG